MNNCKTIVAETDLKIKSVSRAKAFPVSVGVDVAMETLMVCEIYSDGSKKITEIKNCPVSLVRLSRRLFESGFSGKIVMESTGRHHLLSALTMSEWNLDVRVINPLLAKKYSTASIRKVKTDKKDSEILAEMGLKEENLPERFSLDKHTLILKKKAGLIYSISKQLQNLKTMANEHKKTVEGIGGVLSETEKEIFKTIDALRKRKVELEKELEREIYECESRSEKAEKYRTVPGVSPYVAALAALAFSSEYGRDAKQWIAFLGMDISVRQSAKWTGKGKLTKRGNNNLRMRFYSAAWGAVMHNDKFKQYYDYLRKNKGRKHKEALVIVARKIVRILFSLDKNQTVYDDTKHLFLAG